MAPNLALATNLQTSQQNDLLKYPTDDEYKQLEPSTQYIPSLGGCEQVKVDDSVQSAATSYDPTIRACPIEGQPTNVAEPLQVTSVENNTGQNTTSNSVILNSPVSGISERRTVCIDLVKVEPSDHGSSVHNASSISSLSFSTKTSSETSLRCEEKMDDHLVDSDVFVAEDISMDEDYLSTSSYDDDENEMQMKVTGVGKQSNNGVIYIPHPQRLVSSVTRLGPEEVTGIAEKTVSDSSVDFDVNGGSGQTDNEVDKPWSNLPKFLAGGKFQCSQCPEQFDTYVALGGHVILHRVRTPNPNMQDSTNGYCPKCFKHFTGVSVREIMKHKKQCLENKENKQASSGRRRKTDNVDKNCVKNFACVNCKKYFAYKEDLIAHSAKHCTLSATGNTYTNQDTEELQIAERSSSHICQICSRSFTAGYLLDRHKQEHEAISRGAGTERKHVCSICGTYYNLYANLWDHQTSYHRGTMKGACHDLELGKSTNQHIRDNNHEANEYHRNIDESSNYEDSPGHKSKNNSTINTQSPVSTVPTMPLECQICGRKCLKKSGMSHHNKIHEMIDPKTGKEKLYKCKWCSAYFNYAPNCHSHMKEQHSDKVDKDCKKILLKETDKYQKIDGHKYDGAKTTKSPLSTVADMPFQCHTCGKQFRKTSHLSNHLQIHERDDRKSGKRKPYSCKFCCAYFNSAPNCHTHMKGHDTGKAGRDCESRDLEKSDTCKGTAVDEHDNEHNDKRAKTTAVCPLDTAPSVPKKCKICGKRFIMKGSEEKHRQIHEAINQKTGKRKAYTCKFCSAFFNFASSRHSHMKQQHSYRKSTARALSRIGASGTVKYRSKSSIFPGSRTSMHQQEYISPYKNEELAEGNTPKRYLKDITIQRKFANRKSLQSGISEQSCFSCVTCGECFDTASLYSQHSIKHEPYDRKTGLKKGYNCKQCKQFFKVPSVYLKHIFQKHNIKIKRNGHSTEPDSRKKLRGVQVPKVASSSRSTAGSNMNSEDDEEIMMQQHIEVASDAPGFAPKQTGSTLEDKELQSKKSNVGSLGSSIFHPIII